MLIAILVSSFIIVVISFLIQAPIFIWIYKTLVKNIHIDYISTSFWFFVSQLFINLSLIISNKFLNHEFFCSNYQLCYTNIITLVNIFINIIINILVIFLLVLLINKLVLKNKIWDNFFITFLIFLILIIIIPLFFYLYTVF